MIRSSHGNKIKWSWSILSKNQVVQKGGLWVSAEGPTAV
jgi:hypothetical protein